MVIGSNYEKTLNYINNNPGCHLRQIKRELDISVGTVQYQLNKLEKENKINSNRKGLYKFYFPVGLFHENEKQILQILNNKTSREIFLYIIENQNPTQTDISSYFKISNPAVNWHTSRLISYKMIMETKDGKYKRYTITDNAQNAKQIIKLLRNYYSNIWNNWSNRLAEMFILLSSNEDGK